jgi:hypothetical protein
VIPKAAQIEQPLVAAPELPGIACALKTLLPYGNAREEAIAV